MNNLLSCKLTNCILVLRVLSRIKKSLAQFEFWLWVIFVNHLNEQEKKNKSHFNWKWISNSLLHQDSILCTSPQDAAVLLRWSPGSTESLCSMCSMRYWRIWAILWGHSGQALSNEGGVTVAGSETDASTCLGLALCSLVPSTGMHYHNQVWGSAPRSPLTRDSLQMKHFRTLIRNLSKILKSVIMSY